jgi:hypothetical protein
MLNSARDVAVRQYGGNLSAYIQHLIEADMHGAVPDARVSDILDALTKLFRPALASRMHESLKNSDQQLVLDNLLEQILLAVGEDPDADLSKLRVVSASLSNRIRLACRPSELDRLFRKTARDAGIAYPEEGLEEAIAKRMPEPMHRAQTRML